MTAEQLKPENTNEARFLISRAVGEYKLGFFQKAYFYLKISENSSPRWTAKNFEAQKLKALLSQAKEKPAQAAEAMVYALSIKKEPFLFYMLGAFNLSMRAPEQALNSYLSALRAYKPSKAAGEYYSNTLPFYCPGPYKPQPINKFNWMDKRSRNVFRQFEKGESLWNHTLHPLEYAAAAFQALSLIRYLRPNDRKGEARIREHLRKALANPVLEQTAPPEMLELMQNPGDDLRHRRCLLGLKSYKERQEKIINNGSYEPANRNRKLVIMLMRRAHRNRLFRFGDIKSHFSYGSFLHREKHRHEALHIFRRALALSNLKVTSEGVYGNLTTGAQIYHRLSQVYKSFNRFDEATQAARLARLLEIYRNKTQDLGRPAQKKAGLELIKQLVRVSRRNLKNREGLLILIAYYRGRPEERYYRNKLKARDKQFDGEELLSAFFKPLGD